METLLLAPNSFKECADSVRIAELLEIYLQEAILCEITSRPISDGGDGFLNVCKKLFKLEILTAFVSTPYDTEKMEVSYGYNRERREIFIESAEVLGLRRIPLDRRKPLLLNSKGLGELLKIINESGLNVEKVTIGIGGTGTNDLALGLCSVFGLKITGASGNNLNIIPSGYEHASEIEWSRPPLHYEIKLVIDVDNQLLGPKGAARVFAPQKGAGNEEVNALESGFANILNILKHKGIGLPVESLSGAGGGLAAGMQLFLGAECVKSEYFILNELMKDLDFNSFDYVITGEGAFDSQSLLKKGAGVIINKALSLDKKVILVCGKIAPGILDEFGGNVFPVVLSDFFDSPAESIRNIEKGLKTAAFKIRDYLSA